MRRALALEVQQGQITDTQWLNRQHDYDRNGIAVIWIWHSGTSVLHVVCAEGHPGWVFDARRAPARAGLRDAA